MPESQDLTRSSHELSHVEEGHLSDPSYENLEMTRADFMKRQKCSNDNDYYSNKQSPNTPKGMIDDMPLMRNISFAGQLPALSEGKPMNQEEQKDLLGDEVFNPDDVLIDRSAGGGFNNSSFFGLAMVFGAVGMASFMSAAPVDPVSGGGVINSGSRMAGTERIGPSVSITNDVDSTVENYVE